MSFELSNRCSNLAQLARTMADLPAGERAAQFETIALALDDIARKTREVEAELRATKTAKKGTGLFRRGRQRFAAACAQ